MGTFWTYARVKSGVNCCSASQPLASHSRVGLYHLTNVCTSISSAKCFLQRGQRARTPRGVCSPLSRRGTRSFGSKVASFWQPLALHLNFTLLNRRLNIIFQLLPAVNFFA